MVRNSKALGLVFAIVMLIRLAPVQADGYSMPELVPGAFGVSAQSSQTFNLNFDEYGNGSSAPNNPLGAPSPFPGSLSTISPYSVPYLTYTLPNEVNAGTVLILSSPDPAGTSYGGGIYVVQGSDPSLNSLIVGALQFIGSGPSYMQFYTTPPPATPAATGIPPGLVGGAGDYYVAVVETGGNFSYLPGALQQGPANAYFGTVPEPSGIIALLGLLGMAGIGLIYARRTRANVPAN